MVILLFKMARKGGAEALSSAQSAGRLWWALGRNLVLDELRSGVSDGVRESYI